MTVTLSNDLKMPLLGIGTFMMQPDQAEQAVYTALTMGCRMIDTANAYMNERAVGRAIRRSGVPREDIFLSTKIWASEYEKENAVEKTLEIPIVYRQRSHMVLHFYSSLFIPSTARHTKPTLPVSAAAL